MFNDQAPQDMQGTSEKGGTNATTLKSQDAQKGVVCKADKGVKTKKSRVRKNQFSSSIHKVLKEQQKNTGISVRAMAVMESFMGDMFERIADHASQLAAHEGRSNIVVKDVVSAVRLVLPPELAEFAERHGNEALDKYSSAAN